MILAHNQNWWGITIRGIIAVLLGLVALFNPAMSLTSLTILFGSYLVIDGILSAVAASRGANENKSWGALLSEGIISIITGLVILLWPNLSVLGLIYFVSAWIIVTGIIRINEAMSIRKEVKDEWSLMLSGIIAIILGLLLFAVPGESSLLAIRLVGGYLVFFGVMILALAVRIRDIMKMHHV